MSSAAGKRTRATAAAFAIGLSLSAPGLATADTGDTDTSPAAQAGGPAERPGSTARAAAGTARSPQTTPSRRPSVASPVPRASAASAAPETSPISRVSGNNDAPARSAARRTAAKPAAHIIDRVRSSRTALGKNVFESMTRAAAVPAPDAVNDLAAADVTITPEAPSTPTAIDLAAAARGLTVAAVPTAAAAATDWFSGLFGPAQSFFEGIALLVRRTFFNQAPTVAPVQTTGQLIGPITGTVGATDPEGDPLTYAVTAQPRYGSVTLSADGDYVYTPGAEFTGLDSFNVAVTDTGFHLNLFDLSRPASTEAFLQVAQNATAPMLTFSFVYGSGSQYWSSAARGALQDAATLLAMSVLVDAPTTIVYEVNGESDPLSSTLASAGSDLVAPGAGFFATVVQQKIQSGTDANGAAADGDITFNFGNPWAFGTSVGRNQYDFTSTAMHELLHTFGLLSYTEDPGGNTGRSWTTFDQFLVTADGSRVINNNYRWSSAYNINLTGGGGGLYFGGPNAVAAYGGPVPLYTPWPWEWGSSVTHLDDDSFTGADTMLMNAVTDTGLGVRVLSPVELAILKDLGYTVFEPGPLQAMVLIGFGFLRRRAQRPVS